MDHLWQTGISLQPVAPDIALASGDAQEQHDDVKAEAREVWMAHTNRQRSFKVWLLAMQGAPGALGDLARDVARDTTFPMHVTRWDDVETYLENRHADEDAIATARQAYALWLEAR